MKKLLYTLGILLLISSCKNIEKMVEKGKYDEAIAYAAKKLAGKKHKKTQHVKALEKAFAKVTARDMDLLDSYDAENNPAYWDRVLGIANKIDRRQSTIKPFLPLISENGYEASFKFVKTKGLKNSALDGGAEFRYNIALEKLRKAKVNNSKSYARNAYDAFKLVEEYRVNYKDTYTLKDEAFTLGIAHIKLEVDNNSNVYTPFEIKQALKDLRIYNLNSKWKKFYYNEVNEFDYDFTARLELLDIDVSPERETVTHHTDEKKVKDGWEYALTRDGKNKIDSSGNLIKKDIFKIVSADITEIKRLKSSFVAGRIIFIDNNRQAIIDEVPLSVETNFDDYALQFRGDRRALCNHDLSRLKPDPIPFPHDISMILDATDILKSKFIDELRSLHV